MMINSELLRQIKSPYRRVGSQAERSLIFQNPNSALFHMRPVLQRTIYISIHRNCRIALWLNKRFMGVLRGGEIHCLRRLRKEGFPDFLRRSSQLVRRNAAQFVCQRAIRQFCPYPNMKRSTK